jgi:glycosyltransferase involved in cell wall biosynthesis
VGAKHDLVRDGETGRVFPCGDIEGLAKILRSLLGERSQLERFSEAAKERMKTWTPEINAEAFVHAIRFALQGEPKLEQQAE